MGQNTSGFVMAILKSQPLIVVLAIGKLMAIGLACAFILNLLALSVGKSARFLFGLMFFMACVVREAALYPAMAENWGLISRFSELRNGVQWLASAPLGSTFRAFLEWLPFCVVCVAAVINILVLIRLLGLQNSRFRNVRRSLKVSELDQESRRYAVLAFSLVLSLVGTFTGLYCLSSSFYANIPKSDGRQRKPNVFIFAIDSLRFDRLSKPEYADVMPFLRSKMKSAAFSAPLLVGVPRTFPSWTEMATCKYAHRTGIREMFPRRGPRLETPPTIFRAFQNNGYSTLFLSDFAGDIFDRYPFGAKEVLAPTSNLRTLIENSFLQHLVALQSVLALPRAHRLVSSLLESAEFADPKLLGLVFRKALAEEASAGEGIFFTTFFSAAHFPYAAPSPYYSIFQTPEEGWLAFRKDTEQLVEAQGNVTARTKRTASQKQTVELYNGALRSIDDTLKGLWEDLEKRGWLENSVVMVLGDHGENLYEGTLGMGHGDGVSGEFATQSALLIWAKGEPEEVLAHSRERRLARSIDVAPTLAQLTSVPFAMENCDGTTLLGVAQKAPQFPVEEAYQESGIWFVSGDKTPENRKRVAYPGIVGLLDIDAGHNLEFVLKSSFSIPTMSVKERAWVTDQFRLVATTLSDGVTFSLFDRIADPSSERDLLLGPQPTEQALRVAKVLIKRLNDYLESRGVERVANAEGRFFYAENTEK
jgi:arylsulfatase A-like enzyme